jgi:hypothetical protein
MDQPNHLPYQGLPAVWQLPYPNGSGLMPSGEANFVDVRQYYPTESSLLPINAYYPVGDEGLKPEHREYPPQVWWTLADPTTALQVGFLLSGLYVTYPTRTSGHLIGQGWPHDGKGNPHTSGINYSVLAPDRLAFREANLSNAVDSLAYVTQEGLYDFSIFNPYVHYYGKNPGQSATSPMPKWKDVAGAKHDEESTLKSFSDAVHLNYKNLYPKVKPKGIWKQYEDHEQYEPTSEEAGCAASGGVWMSGKCYK